MNQMNRLALGLLATTLTALTPAAQVIAVDYYVAGNVETDTVSFASQAKLEFIEGTTHTISGVISFDPQNTSLPASGRLRVDARTLRTGIELRDEHMRDRHLHTEQFPYIEFTLKSISGLPAALTPGDSYAFQVMGQFSVHGSTRDVTAAASVTLTALDSTHSQLAVRATFPIKLDDYSIPRPKALFLKLAETVDITVSFVASTSNPKIEF